MQQAASALPAALPDHVFGTQIGRRAGPAEAVSAGPLLSMPGFFCEGQIQSPT